MGFLSTFAKRELKRARKLAGADPSPLAYSTLADKYLMVGDVEGALSVTQEGLRLFPGSDMLNRTHGSAKRRMLEEEFRQLNSELAREADAETMVRLARLYVETGEESKVLEICARTIEMFPEHEDPYAIVAGIRLQRFYNGLAIKDAQMAVANLEQVIGFNPQNYKAYQMLAEFYLRVGMVSGAIQCLRKMLAFSPDDEWTRSKMDEATRLPQRDGESLEGLLLEYREQHGLTRQAATVALAAEGETDASLDRPSAQPPPAQVIEKVDALSRKPGFAAGVLLDGCGRVLHEAFGPGVGPLRFDAMVRSITAVAERHSLRMDIGQFRKGLISGSFGHAILQANSDLIFGVMLAQGARLDNFEDEVESIADGTAAMQRGITAETPASRQEGS